MRRALLMLLLSSAVQPALAADDRIQRAMACTAAQDSLVRLKCFDAVFSSSGEGPLLEYHPYQTSPYDGIDATEELPEREGSDPTDATEPVN